MSAVPLVAFAAEPTFTVHWVTPQLILAPGESALNRGTAIFAGSQNQGPMALLLAIREEGPVRSVLLVDAKAGLRAGAVLSGLNEPRGWSRLWNRILSSGSSREPTLLSLAEAPGGTFWLGGVANAGTSMISTPYGDAYLARVTADGAIVDEFTVDETWWSTVTALVGAQDDQVVAAGADDASGWIGVIDAHGDVAGRRSFGLRKGVALATLNGTVYAVGLIAEGEGALYSEHVAVWSYRDGRLGSPTIMRRNINGSRSSQSAVLQTAATHDALYILSGWRGPGPAVPLQLAQWGESGDVQWTRDFAHCNGAESAVADLDGSPLVMCASRTGLTVDRFDREGDRTLSHRFDIPGCVPGGRGNGTLLASSEGPQRVIIAGTVAGCTWVGELTVPTPASKE